MAGLEAKVISAVLYRALAAARGKTLAWPSMRDLTAI